MHWLDLQKQIVLDHLKTHINKKIAPKKHECEELIKKHKNILKDVGWVRVKTLVYNSFRLK